ncbi:hypothetical protein ACE38W_03900 [Chitinophaga sp. Hz27]|uniref:hypothetical protein n=1 Tax=Chitinophaga sp. Hz27 TaxID=3347169 RepID=UPI0035D8058D
MNKYTFVTIFREGVHIHQAEGTDITEAMVNWAKIPDKKIKFIGHESQKEIELAIEEEHPTPINGVDNVWFFMVRTRAGLLMVNVIQTI